MGRFAELNKRTNTMDHPWLWGVIGGCVFAATMFTVAYFAVRKHDRPTLLAISISLVFAYALMYRIVVAVLSRRPHRKQ